MAKISVSASGMSSSLLLSIAFSPELDHEPLLAVPSLPDARPKTLDVLPDAGGDELNFTCDFFRICRPLTAVLDVIKKQLVGGVRVITYGQPFAPEGGQGSAFLFGCRKLRLDFRATQ